MRRGDRQQLRGNVNHSVGIIEQNNSADCEAMQRKVPVRRLDAERPISQAEPKGCQAIESERAFADQNIRFRLVPR